MGAEADLAAFIKTVSDTFSVKGDMGDENDRHRQIADFVRDVRRLRRLLKRIKTKTGVDLTQKVLDYIGDPVD